MSTVGEAFVAIRPEGANFAAEAERLITGGLGPAAAKAATIVGGIFVGREAINFAKEGVARLEDIQKTATITEARIKATGEAAGVSAKHIEDLALAQQNLSGTDRELILQGENVLLGFQKIKAQGGIFDETVKDATDLSVALGQDAPSAARNLGRALEDPTKASRALRAENVILTASQNDQIKAFEKAGQNAKAQEVILKAVEAQVGGTAAAFGQTLAGQLELAQISLKDTKASLLEGAAPGLELVAGLTTKLAGSIQGLPGPLKEVASLTLGGGVAYVALARPLSAAFDLFGKLKDTLPGTTAAAEADAKAATEQATAKTAATEALIAHTVALNDNTLALRGNVLASEAEVGAAGEQVVAGDAIIANDAEVVTANEAVTASAATMSTGGLALVGAAAFGAGFGLLKLADDAGGIPGIFGSVEDAASGLQDRLSSLPQSLEDIRNDLLGLKNAALDLPGNLLDLGGSIPTDKLQSGAAATDGFGQSLLDLVGKQQLSNAVDLTSVDALDALKTKISDVSKEEDTRLTAVNAAISAGRAYQDSLQATADATSSLESAQTSLLSAEQRLADANRLSPSEDRAKVELDLKDAKLRQADATKAVGDEEQKLADLRGAHGGTRGSITEIAAQERRLQEARDAVQRSVFAVTDAERALQTVQADGTAADQAQTAAQAGVEQATRGVEDAKRKLSATYQAQIDSETKLRIEQLKSTGVTVDAGKAISIQVAAVRDLEKNINRSSPLHSAFDEQIKQLLTISRLAAPLAPLITATAQASALLSAQGLTNNNFQNVINLIQGKVKFGGAAAAGLETSVNSPTLFLAGEAGREHVSITPGGPPSGQGGGPVFGPGSIVVQFVGVVPTPDQAYGVGRNVGAGIAQMTRDVRVAVGTR